jgi:hypothetical protein
MSNFSHRFTHDISINTQIWLQTKMFTNKLTTNIEMDETTKSMSYIFH